MAIIRDYPATIRAINNCFGKIVSDITRVQSYFNNEEDTDGFGDLEFKFMDNSYLTLTGLGDAESIVAYNDKIKIPKPYNN